MTSIRTKLSIGLSVAALATAFAIGLVTYRHTLNENQALFDYQLKQIALSLRDTGWIQPPARDDARRGEELNVVIQIWTANGNILYLSHPDNPIPTKAPLGYADMAGATRRWRVYSLLEGDRIIQVAQPFELRQGLAASAALRSLTPLLAFVPIMAALIWWLVGHALNPVRRVANEVASRDERLLEAIPGKDLPSEIAPLVSAFNTLLDRLNHAFASQQAFVADAAHELRSPLTALTLQIQLLSRATDASERIEAMNQLKQGIERATRLVEQLLTAARMEEEDIHPMQGVDLAELVRQTIAELFDFMQQRQVDIELNAPEQTLIRGEPASLQMLIRNLLDNAIRYSPERAVIRVHIASQSGKTILTFEDSGPGIPEQDRARVFDRFYRGGDQQQSGSGLGLSIVKQVAERHNAALLLDASPLGGLKVSVAFPD
ncbi:ATP-binding protein [Oxalobacteraceae bacterium R-40]|uniref:histidine kinase n=1 Tax=Keguizhuia sedimenti TaxID=3064264 RepID=A0ABU1BRR0_9BURK|nr:ATP-binding protein [Oxalobacteraceae bacterium R-40]